MSSFITNNSTSQDYVESHFGIVHDVVSSEKGYVFMFDDSEELTYKCFAYIKPSELELYVIKGNFSEDRNIFFISSMELLTPR
jgi:hypothetical protein